LPIASWPTTGGNYSAEAAQDWSKGCASCAKDRGSFSWGLSIEGAFCSGAFCNILPAAWQIVFWLWLMAAKSW